MIRRIHNTNCESRRGVAASEFAVCLPLLLVIVFGTIEACTMVFLKQSLTIAAYEGSRKAIEYRATTSQVQQICQQILDDRRVQNARIRITPSDVSLVPEGQYITIQITAPCNSNSVLRGWFFTNQRMRARVRMMKEFTD